VALISSKRGKGGENYDPPFLPNTHFYFVVREKENSREGKSSPKRSRGEDSHTTFRSPGQYGSLKEGKWRSLGGVIELHEGRKKRGLTDRKRRELEGLGRWWRGKAGMVEGGRREKKEDEAAFPAARGGKDHSTPFPGRVMDVRRGRNRDAAFGGTKRRESAKSAAKERKSQSRFVEARGGGREQKKGRQIGCGLRGEKESF